VCCMHHLCRVSDTLYAGRFCTSAGRRRRNATNWNRNCWSYTTRYGIVICRAGNCSCHMSRQCMSICFAFKL